MTGAPRMGRILCGDGVPGTPRPTFGGTYLELGDLAVQLRGGLRVQIGSRASRARVCDLDLQRNACR